jgi:hypothetical protein
VTGGVASLRWEGAPGPTHEDGWQVRRLGTNGMAKIEAEHGSDGLLESRREATAGAQTE